MKWVCSSRASSWGPRSSPWPSSRPSGGSSASSCLSLCPEVLTNLSFRCWSQNLPFSINFVISGLSDHHCILLLAVLALLLHVPGHILFLPDENFFSMCSMMFYPVCRWTPWLARSLRRKRFTRWSSSGTVARTISRQHWSWTVFSKIFWPWSFFLVPLLIWPSSLKSGQDPIAN